MWLYLQQETDFFTNKQEVLHIAPEQCFHGKFKAQKNLKYLTGDLVSPLAELHFDLHEIPLEDDRFDVIFCNHVLEHVDDRSEEHTSELQSRPHLVCRLLLEKKKMQLPQPRRCSSCWS